MNQKENVKKANMRKILIWKREFEKENIKKKSRNIKRKWQEDAKKEQKIFK